MPDAFLPCINPVDLSGPNGTNPPAGGFLGNGSLTSDDGDATGWESWNSTSALSGSDPGFDVFRYNVDASGVPAGATLTSYRFEAVVRLVSPAVPQHDIDVGASPSWSDNMTLLIHYWSGTPADYNYALAVGSTRAVMSSLVTQLGNGSATLTMGVEMRNTNVSTGLGAARCTMAGLRVYYTLPAPPAATHAPPLRQFPRNDGLAGSARRSWPPPRSIQRSQRRAGGYL